MTAYGARGDGSSDDTAAFEATRDAAGAGGHVRVPPGTYIVAGVLLNIVGQQWSLDPGATLKLRDGANTAVILLHARDVQLRGGEIDGNQANQSPDLYRICVAVRSPRVIVEGVEIGQCSGWGIYVGGASGTKLLRNNIHDTTGAAIFVEGGTNGAVIDNNTIQRTLYSGSGGIIVHGNDVDVPSSGSRITNNRVSNTAQIAIEVWGLAPDSHIEGNTTYGGLMGISVDRSDRTVVTGNSVKADRSRSEWIGLEIARSKNVLLSNNKVDGDEAPRSNGVFVSNTTPHDNVITANTIVRTWRPINLDGAYRNKVTDNTIESYSYYAVDIRADEVTVTGNVITNGLPGSVAVILDNSNGSVIDRNTIRNCDRGVVLYQAGTGTTDTDRVTNNRFESCTIPIQTLGSVGGKNVVANNIVVP